MIGSRENDGIEAVRAELRDTQTRLREMEYLLESIQSGKADALVIDGPAGEQVFTLKSLDTLMDSIIDHSLGATFLVDHQGVIRNASAVAMELIGMDLRGRPFDEAFPLVPARSASEEPGGEEASKAPFSLASVLAGKTVTGDEVAFVRADGTTLGFLLAAKPLSAFGGYFTGAVVHLQDITDRKRNEIQLIVREKQLRYQFELTKTITDNTAEALLLTDRDGRVLFMNLAAEALLGRTQAEMLGRSLHAEVHPHHAEGTTAERPCPLKDLLAGSSLGVNEDTFHRASGKPLAVRYSMAPVVSDGKVIGSVLSVGDVTQRNATETALRLSEEKLRQSQKMEAVGRLAGGIAHDFNNLLTAINGYSALALGVVESAHPVHGYLEEIQKAGERAASLTGQLLAYSRKQILTFKVLDLNGLVGDILAIIKRTLPENIRHEAALGPDPIQVAADPARLQQVMINLAINARDAMPGGGTLRVSTAVIRIDRTDRSGLLGEMSRDEAEEGLLPGEYAEVIIADSGHGMDEYVKAHLFEPFFTTKEVGKGTGLGLSMAYGIVKQSKGHIQVFSEVGKGTTIRILLPLVHGEAAKAPRPEPAGRFQGVETILVAEDEESVLRLIRQVLKGSGYRVLEARDGREALEVSDAFSGRIDLLLTDMVMGGMGGRDLASALARKRPETLRMFISGYTEDFQPKEGIQEEDTFLQKPFLPDVLARTVRQVLDRGQVANPRATRPSLPG